MAEQDTTNRDLSNMDQKQAAEDEGAEIPKAATDTNTAKTTTSKVAVLLKATGDAPIVKKKKWSIDSNKKIGFINDFIRKLIKCEPQDSLFLYVNQSFAPAPDVEVGTLYDCFGSDGKLILHYCKTQAWG